MSDRRPHVEEARRVSPRGEGAARIAELLAVGETVAIAVGVAADGVPDEETVAEGTAEGIECGAAEAVGSASTTWVGRITITVVASIGSSRIENSPSMLSSSRRTP